VRGRTMHYLESGAGDPVVFLHGNPSSSHMWRDVIPHLADRARCLAPDFVGMGRSEKPDLEYTLEYHSECIDEFIDKLGLRSLTFVMHDAGSYVGLRHAMRSSGAVRGVALMESLLVPGIPWSTFPPFLRETFRAFRDPVTGDRLILDDNVFVEQVLSRGCINGLAPEVLEKYREPFPDRASRKAMSRFPRQIPLGGEPEAVVATIRDYLEFLRVADLPKLVLYADPGTLTPRAVADWCGEAFENVDVVSLGAGLHYVTEESPSLIGEALSRWYTSKVVRGQA
jgi:haloalkane dehalogenase